MPVLFYPGWVIGLDRMHHRGPFRELNREFAPPATQLAGANVADRGVLILLAGRTERHQQLCDGVLGHAGHADRGSDAVAFHESRYHRCPSRRRQLVHERYYA